MLTLIPKINKNKENVRHTIRFHISKDIQCKTTILTFVTWLLVRNDRWPHRLSDIY